MNNFDIIKNEIVAKTSIIVSIFFIGLMMGYFLKSCPPKSEVCEGEIKTIAKQFEQLSAKDTEWTNKLREQRDKDTNSCDDRIRTEVRRVKQTSNIVQCEEVCVLYPQCKSAGRCK